MADGLLDEQEHYAKRSEQIREQLADREPGGGNKNSAEVAKWRALRAEIQAVEVAKRREKSLIEIQNIPCFTDSLKRTLAEQDYWHGPVMQEYRQQMTAESQEQ